jgi:magnesium chelatase family protein
MRQPLEDRKSQYQELNLGLILIIYVSSEYELSPSGFFNDPDSPQTSSPHEMQRYLSKISGPLLDRIDIHIEVTLFLLKNYQTTKRQKAAST